MNTSLVIRDKASSAASHGLVITPALRTCSHCNKDEPPAAGRPSFYRCGRCLDPFYCGKECQRAAWPVHKLTCRMSEGERTEARERNEDMLAAFGLPSSTKLGHQLRDFILAHRWAFETLSKIAVKVCNPSPTPSLPWETPIVVYNLAYLKNRNPARTFTLAGMTCTSVERTGFLEPSFKETYGTTAPHRVHAHERYKASAGEGYMGLLPVRFVTNVGLSPVFYFPRLRPRLQGAIAERPLWNDAMADVAVTCYTGIRDGIPIRNTDKLDPVVSVPGYFVRDRKRWTWRPQCEGWAAFDGVVDRMRWQPSRSFSRLPPESAMRLLDYL
ncbi:hypothetical protein C8T65DRAFT_657629 [Cerioporus squamosus]|nr:hypothetical protein C8T65DRAFT_657629 [Cerioporus squamosus]